MSNGEERQTGWVIENRCMTPVAYYCGGAGGKSFSADHAEAIRFCRKEDAERCLTFFVRDPVQGCCEASEHVWLASPSAVEAAEVVGWQPGERALALKWATKLLAKLSTKPDHADDCLWLIRLSYFFASPPPASPSAPQGVEVRWYLGAMNDGLFIINTPPRPSAEDAWHGRPDGPTMVLNVNDLPEAKARAIVDAHNSAIQTSPEAGR